MKEIKKIIVASNNSGKIKEINEILGQRFEIISQRDAGINIDVDENGSSFLENAIIKAKVIYDLTGEATLSDDSGLMVDALFGAPGIYSARYAGTGNSQDNNMLLLKNLANETNRKAKFVCAIVLYYDDNKYISAIGETYGKILLEPSGDMGFGYDPIFFSTEINKSFGEATLAEKNIVSHRARALQALLEKIISISN